MMGRKRLVPGASAIYLFNEGAGQVLRDYSGNGNHGTFAGTTPPTWTSRGISLTSDAHILVPGLNAALAGKTGCTVIAVAKSPGAVQYSGILGTTTTTAADRTVTLFPVHDGTNTITFSLSDGSTITQGQAPGTLSTTAFECLVGRFVGRGAVQVRHASGEWGTQATNVPAAISPSPADGAAIGRHGSNYFGGGLGAELAALLVYPYALTDAQIAQDIACISDTLAPRGIDLPK